MKNLLVIIELLKDLQADIKDKRLTEEAFKNYIAAIHQLLVRMQADSESNLKIFGSNNELLRQPVLKGAYAANHDAIIETLNIFRRLATFHGKGLAIVLADLKFNVENDVEGLIANRDQIDSANAPKKGEVVNNLAATATELHACIRDIQQGEQLIRAQGFGNCATHAWILAAADSIVGGELDLNEDEDTDAIQQDKTSAHRWWVDLFNNNKIDGRQDWNFNDIKTYFTRQDTYDAQLQLQFRFASILRKAAYDINRSDIAHYKQKTLRYLIAEFEYYVKQRLGLLQQIEAGDIFTQCPAVKVVFDALLQKHKFQQENIAPELENATTDLQEEWMSNDKLARDFLEYTNKSGVWIGDLELAPITEAAGFNLRARKINFQTKQPYDYSVTEIHGVFEIPAGTPNRESIIKILRDRAVIEREVRPSDGNRVRFLFFPNSVAFRERLIAASAVVALEDRAFIAGLTQSPQPERLTADRIAALKQNTIQILKDRNILTLSNNRTVITPDLSSAELKVRLEACPDAERMTTAYDTNKLMRPVLTLFNPFGSHWDCVTRRHWLKNAHEFIPIITQTMDFSKSTMLPSIYVATVKDVDFSNTHWRLIETENNKLLDDRTLEATEFLLEYLEIFDADALSDNKKTVVCDFIHKALVQYLKAQKGKNLDRSVFHALLCNDQAVLTETEENKADIKYLEHYKAFLRHVMVRDVPAETPIFMAWAHAQNRELFLWVKHPDDPALPLEENRTIRMGMHVPRVPEPQSTTAPSTIPATTAAGEPKRNNYRTYPSPATGASAMTTPVQPKIKPAHFLLVHDANGKLVFKALQSKKMHHLEYAAVHQVLINQDGKANAKESLYIPQKILPKYASVHEIIDIMDWLAHLLVKKHNIYKKLLWTKEKYTDVIRELRALLARMIEEAIISLPIIERNPELAAYLVNKTPDTSSTREPGVNNKYFVEYKRALEKTISAFDRLNKLDHMGKETPDNILQMRAQLTERRKARADLLEAKKLVAFRWHDLAPNEPIPDPYQESKRRGKAESSKARREHDLDFSVRYLKNERTENDSEYQIYEKRLKVEIHRYRDNALNNLRLFGIVLTPSSLLGAAGAYFAEEYMRHSGYFLRASIPFGLAIGATAGLVSYFGTRYGSQNAYMKHHRVQKNIGDNPLGEPVKPPRAPSQRAIKTPAQQILKAKEDLLQIMAQARRVADSDEGEITLLASARAVAEAVVHIIKTSKDDVVVPEELAQYIAKMEEIINRVPIEEQQRLKELLSAMRQDIRRLPRSDELNYAERLAKAAKELAEKFKGLVLEAEQKALTALGPAVEENADARLKLEEAARRLRQAANNLVTEVNHFPRIRLERQLEDYVAEISAEDELKESRERRIPALNQRLAELDEKLDKLKIRKNQEISPLIQKIHNMLNNEGKLNLDVLSSELTNLDRAIEAHKVAVSARALQSVGTYSTSTGSREVRGDKDMKDKKEPDEKTKLLPSPLN